MNRLDTVKKEDEILYNNWCTHLNNTRDRTNYSARRQDLLIISICGAGIYIVFETFREISSKTLIVDDGTLIKLSGIAFLLAIVLNFMSQITGFKANDNEEKYTLIELDRIEGKDFDESRQNLCDTYSKNYTLATSILNISSIILMFIGLLLLAIFNFNLF